MSSVIQRVSNWLLGDYPVAASQVGSGSTAKLIQWIMTVDANGNYVDASGGAGVTATSLAGSGRQTVTTAGTAVALASTTSSSRVIITAETDNTGLIAVGVSGHTVAAPGTQEGMILSPGQSTEFAITDLANVYIDSTVNGDGVTYAYTA